jgi:hypothetical protein
VRKFFTGGGLLYMAIVGTIHLFDVGVGDFIEPHMTAFTP